MDVTLLPRITYPTKEDEYRYSHASNKRTYNSPNRVLLSRVGLLQSLIDYKVQEQIISTQRPADFTTTLKMDEEFLVHEL